MIPYGFGYRQRTGDHHWMLGAAAFLFSVIIHLVMVFFFSDLQLTGAATMRQRQRAHFDLSKVPPMRVESIMQIDPMQHSDKLPGERDTPSRGPLESGGKLEELSQSATTVAETPPPVPREALDPGTTALKEAISDQIDTTPWMPRQEIAQIFDRAIDNDLAFLPRHEIPMIERVPEAPDIVPSIDFSGRTFGKEVTPPKPIKSAEIFDTHIEQGTYKRVKPDAPAIPTTADIAATTVKPGTTEERFGIKPDQAGHEAGAAAERQKAIEKQRQQLKKDLDAALAEGRITQDVRKALETQASISELQDQLEYIPIDDMLAVGLETYTSEDDPSNIYFRIGIQPRDDKEMRVIPKDIVFVQDVSASMSEDRMFFCRRALAEALQTINVDDRFNIVAFRDTFEACSPEWMPVSKENLDKSAVFVDRLRAFGQTDIFGSLQALMKLPRDPKRPMIAMIITDGKPTYGVTESAKIIGDFAALNNGMIAIYMFGTTKQANTYLLDMLTYCNRGTSLVLSGNRWDIPEAMAHVYKGVRYPVMSDVSITFYTSSRSEVYPRRTTNLYKDRQLEICGICPVNTVELVFQIRGTAIDKGYDSIFRLNMKQHAQAGAPAVKVRWALHKMYHLVAEYSRKPSPQIMEEMRKLNRTYNIAIPYRDELK